MKEPGIERRRELRAAAVILGGSPEYFAAAEKQKFPQWAADEMLPCFIALNITPAEFFESLLADWEYELLSRRSDTDGLEGRTGFLTLVRAGVPFGYFHSLAAYEEQRVTQLDSYGYEEV